MSPSGVPSDGEVDRGLDAAAGTGSGTGSGTGAGTSADITPETEVEVRRSVRRRRTVSARRDGARIVVLIPATMSAADERRWVHTMVGRIRRSEQRRRLSDHDLAERARRLSDTWLGGLADPASVRWVDNQRTRWGSCTPGDRSIRLSSRMHGMPGWVVDYVLVHELAHLIEPGHDARFWAWVRQYPHVEKAQGYLLGWSAAAREEPPPEDHSG